MSLATTPPPPRPSAPAEPAAPWPSPRSPWSWSAPWRSTPRSCASGRPRTSVRPASPPTPTGRPRVPKIQAAVEAKAVDAATLAAALAADSAAGCHHQYGVASGTGPLFSVHFTGTVGTGKSGIYTVSVAGMPAGDGIRVQTGPAINGTELRDATGEIQFGQFKNQIEFQNAGSAINKR